MAWLSPSSAPPMTARAAFTTGCAMAWATSGAPASRTTTGSTTRCGLPRWLPCSPTSWAWPLASSSTWSPRWVSNLPLCGSSTLWAAQRRPTPSGSLTVAPSSRSPSPLSLALWAFGMPWRTVLRTTCPLPPSCPSSPTPTLSVTCRSSSLTSWASRSSAP